MGGAFGGGASEAQLASLNAQLAASRKEVKALQQQLAGLQAEQQQLAGHAAAREGALTAEVRRVALRAAEAARAAADDKAALLGQVSGASQYERFDERCTQAAVSNKAQCHCQGSSR
jgi:hypothetical protein